MFKKKTTCHSFNSHMQRKRKIGTKIYFVGQAWVPIQPGFYGVKHSNSITLTNYNWWKINEQK